MIFPSLWTCLFGYLRWLVKEEQMAFVQPLLRLRHYLINFRVFPPPPVFDVQYDSQDCYSVACFCVFAYLGSNIPAQSLAFCPVRLQAEHSAGNRDTCSAIFASIHPTITPRAAPLSWPSASVIAYGSSAVQCFPKALYASAGMRPH